MINLKRSIRYFIRGMGYGSITYLAIIAFLTPNMTVSTTSVFTVFIISGLIGELSFVFQTELPYSIALIIHLIGTFILYSVMMLINHWPLNWQTIIIFIIAYIAIWLFIRLLEEQHINRINKQIRNRQK
ncbi:DUF3021 domain-containing protein [Limosilactobacillus reuteri]|uniref:DUF3021 domain-containing protein n=1 Tax=Limosilactobacillus reuteri TaxID=1598 RepID=UPI0015FC3048|nr:DUF3021 domain-containing protein [Limosilactobacillus reuteri]MBB1072310.1 DUF3021 domain-containing protein [Limosilactobacillus reuteri]MCC4322888.1 DUF3021 domain-containing protein [Limosilactobacillus reuteri]MCC4328454.1 DUF3021 domain-containing protein [Limosilactobacillus reuteri]MCC4333157.1 DUF3021 domain-containing protein [Limosilactobacillus reuteri]MCC4336691.1 DUF3021 domain-containing protein [Limosilactobacillus reuteri]